MAAILRAMSQLGIQLEGDGRLVFIKILILIL